MRRGRRCTRSSRTSRPASLRAAPERNDGRTMVFVSRDRDLLRAKDLADARYFEPLGVHDLAHAAGFSRAHFSREFRRAFGESPHTYLLTRRLERAAALLRKTDRSPASASTSGCRASARSPPASPAASVCRRPRTA